MSDSFQSCEEQIRDMLADQAAFGLSSDEREELDALLIMMPDFDQDCMQRMAATVHLASVGKELEPLPASLQQRIRATAQRSHGISSPICQDLRYPG